MALKRPLVSEEEDMASPKRQRTRGPKKHHLNHKQPGALLPVANPQDPKVVDAQIDRMLSVALHSAGFDASQPNAFASLREVTHEYITHFTTRIRQSMMHSRRARPLPHDFDFALRVFNKPLTDLKPHLHQNIPAHITQPPIFPSTPSTPTTKDFDSASSDLVTKTFGSAVAAAHRRHYVPQHFPTFPPPHTYTFTKVMTEREADARRIRERATQEGVLAEQALRKLVAARRPARRAGDARLATNSKDRVAMAEARTEEVFREAMEAVTREDREHGVNGMLQEDRRLLLDGAGDGPGLSEEAATLDLGSAAVVNWDRAHWRRGAASSL